MYEVTGSGDLTGFGARDVSAFRLRQNVPNPFNPMTEIGFSLARRGWVRLSVFNSEGQRVSSGVYLYRLETNEESISRRMILLR